jgi:hypothetical protein
MAEEDKSQAAPRTTTSELREGEQRGRVTPDRPTISPASSDSTSGGGAGKESGGKGKD